MNYQKWKESFAPKWKNFKESVYLLNSNRLSQAAAIVILLIVL